jgi:hypothetical protein
LYGALFALLSAQGYRQVMGGITLPNEASVGLHEAMGFRQVAHYHHVGWKFGRWHDVGWWQRSLGDGPGSELHAGSELQAGSELPTGSELQAGSELQTGSGAGSPPSELRDLTQLDDAEVTAALDVGRAGLVR